MGDRRLGYSYFGKIEHLGINIVIKTDYERPTAFGVNYSSISLPARCYKEKNKKAYVGQDVIIYVYFVDGQWNEEYEVYDSSLCSNLVLETTNGLKR